jgi:hypothetical protein
MGCSLDNMFKYLRQTTSGAVGSGRAKRSSTCEAQRAAPRVFSLDNKANYLGGAMSIGFGQHDQVLPSHSERRRGQRPGHHEQ